MSDFYRELQGGAMRAHQPGQIFWVPAPIICKDALGIRLGFLKEGQDITQLPLTISKLRVDQIGCPTEAHKVEFHRRMPLPEINLRSSEDLLVQKVKKRPAVLLFKSGVAPRRFATHVAGITHAPNPNHYVFAPIYSLRKSDNIDTDYPSVFIKELQESKFPHLLYLPAYKSYLPNDSMVVLNDMFGVGIQSFEETPLAIDSLELASKLDVFFEYFQGEMLLQAEGE